MSSGVIEDQAMPRPLAVHLCVAVLAWATAGGCSLTSAAWAQSTDALKAMNRTLAAYSCKPEVIAEIGTEFVKKARPEETVAQGLRRLPDLNDALHDAVRACGCTAVESQVFREERGVTINGFEDGLRACITASRSSAPGQGAREPPRPTARQLALDARNGEWPKRPEELDALALALVALGRRAAPDSYQAKGCSRAARELERLRSLPRKPGTEPPSLWALQAAAADCLE
jgi:hypothetical protein